MFRIVLISLLVIVFSFPVFNYPVYGGGAWVYWKFNKTIMKGKVIGSKWKIIEVFERESSCETSAKNDFNTKRNLIDATLGRRDKSISFNFNPRKREIVMSFKKQRTKRIILFQCYPIGHDPRS